MNRKERRAESKRGEPPLQRAAQTFEQAVQHHQAGRLHEAVAAYRQAIGFKPDFTNAFYNQGLALQTLGRTSDAVACYSKAIHFKPDFVDAHYNLGLAALEQGRRAEAAAHFRRAVALNPGHADAHYNLGITVRQLGSLDEAAVCYRRAIAARPGYTDAHFNLGIVLVEMGQPGEAAACYQRAIDLNPGYTDAYYNLGLVAQQQGRPADAIGPYRRAIALRPDYADAHASLATALLLQGDMAEGWEAFEWRWQTSIVAGQRRDFTQPQWRGEPAQGKTLLIHAEQGFGDTLQFCRYGVLAASRGLRVIMEVQASLVRLLAGLPGVDQVLGQGEALPPFDLQCLTMSLPLALGTTLQTIPSATAYLHADAAAVELWRSRIAAMPGRGKRIGLAWAGSPTKLADHERSLPPALLTPLLGLPGLHFFSLQKAGPNPFDSATLTDVMAEMRDFADTAALVANLDLVISVDTAVAHLAAALGKPVWLLNRVNTDWRWLTGRSDSPWYPTLRQFRQTSHGDWGPVLDDIIVALRARFPDA